MLHIKHQVLSSCAHLVHDASNSIYLPPTQLGSDYIKYATVSLHGLQSEILIPWWCNNSHVLREHMGYGLAGLLSFMKILHHTPIAHMK